MKKITYFANANIAVVKYWGKACKQLNIPIVSSLSITLDKLGSLTSISETKNEDVLFVNGVQQKEESLNRFKSFLDYFRDTFGIKTFFKVESKNNIPTKAGVASSSSAYASLAAGLNELANINLPNKELSLLARLGSASAARSIFPFAAGLYGGENLSHEEAFGFSVNSPSIKDLRLIIILVSEKEKKISSRKAMIKSEESPFFKTFVQESKKDFHDGLNALQNCDLESLGTIMEHSTLKMHSVLWTLKPALNYFTSQSLAFMERICLLREQYGPIAFFTLDAGPNVKVLCHKDALEKIIEFLELDKQSIKYLISSPGNGVEKIDDR